MVSDTHGDLGIHKLTKRKFLFNDLTKEDYLIILGDAGITWYGNKKDNYLINWYNSKPWTTLFIDGNHENFNSLYSYPIIDWNGGKVGKISDSILHLRRGEIYTINNKKFFCFGGAESIDRIYRKEGVSWWKEEIPSKEEYEYAITNLENIGYEVDYILSHAIDTFNLKAIFPSYHSDIVTDYLLNLKSLTSYKHHYCGHYHADITFNNTTIMYNDVIELEA